MTQNNKSFYITTTIPYVNADPHIGFALELVQSDAIARYQRLIGKEVFFSTGTDEYGQKIWEASQKEGIPVQDYVDRYAEKFVELQKVLNLSCDSFIRTTSKENIAAAQEFWRLCEAKGDIYKSKYVGLYCVGCETFYPEKDLVEGKCPIHMTVAEKIEEENYFFRLKKYKTELLKYLGNEKAILPEWRRQEAINFVENAMEDFSVSRNKERLAWGIPIPGDDTQVMYVWFGAFVNYISTLGWPGEKGKFEKFWQDGFTVQTAGKDMVKFQSVMWQGMLMSAGLKNTDAILYHGFITGEGGIKMSKSLGNVINPSEIVKEYGADALRYFLLREISSFEDSPFTMDRFKDAYNSGLANGLGNLVSRVMTMSQTHLEPLDLSQVKFFPDQPNGQDEIFTIALSNFNLKTALDRIWFFLSIYDLTIQNDAPFKLIKTEPEVAKNLMKGLVAGLYNIATMLEPFLPETAEKIKKCVLENKKPAQPLFLRKG
jgi:methionyl-tRNA synthetase